MATFSMAAKAALLAIGLLAVGAACSSEPTPTPTPAPTATPAPTPTSTLAPMPTATPTPVPVTPLRIGMLDLARTDHIVHHNRADGPIARAALLAIKHVNDAGGVFGLPVEAHFLDTDGEDGARGPDSAAAVEHAQRLIDEEGSHALIGPLYSTDTAAVALEVAAPRQIPVISPISSSPLLTTLEDDGFVFRTTLSTIAEADAIARLAEDEGYRHVAVIYQDDYWGRPVDLAFEDHFDGKTTSVPIKLEQESYHEETLAAEAHDPDAVMIATSVQDSYTVIHNIIEEGHFNENFLLMGHHKRAAVIERHPELEGAKGVALYGHHVTEAEGHWEEDYTAVYGEEAPHGPYPRESYDAAIAIMLAAEYAGSVDGAAIRDALPIVAGPPGIRFPASSAGVKGALAAVRNGQDIDLDGEATSLDWDANGDITVGGVEVWQFQNGGIVSLRVYEIDIRE